jgi:hypothetical protein
MPGVKPSEGEERLPTMHPLVKAFIEATRYGWRRRTAILLLLVLLWLPVEAIAVRLPVERSAIAKMALEGLVEPLWIGALLHLCRADLKGKPIGTITALRRASSSYARLFGVRTVLETRILFGLVAGIVPGVVMFGRYALMDVLAICENVGPTQCRARSSGLLEKDITAVLVLLLVANLLPLGLDQLVDLASEAASNGIVTALLNTAGLVVSAFLPLTLFEFYRTASGKFT